MPRTIVTRLRSITIWIPVGFRLGSVGAGLGRRRAPLPVASHLCLDPKDGACIWVPGQELRLHRGGSDWEGWLIYGIMASRCPTK